MTDNYKTKYPIGSQWKTRGGWRAVVIRLDDNAIIVAQDNPNHCEIMRHKNDGTTKYEKYDLIEPWKEPRTKEVWVYWTKEGFVHAAERPTIICGVGKVTARRKITLTEGEIEE